MNNQQSTINNQQSTFSIVTPSFNQLDWPALLRSDCLLKIANSNYGIIPLS
jgi:hypothetical protein